ncbi:MAG: YraN family protein [Cyclobacteriaceae bacterium]|jgi:putative endonuclease|nr:YraN family protein [Cyclobacteriaceae bacterium]
MSDKIRIGKQGEDLAAKFLEQKGFRVLMRNYRYKHAEIDLIVQKENWLIFVEVKARSSTAFGQPETFVDLKKGRKIMEAADEYIYSTRWQGHIRFDIISVKLGEPPEITHFEDAIN